MTKPKGKVLHEATPRKTPFTERGIDWTGMVTAMRTQPGEWWQFDDLVDLPNVRSVYLTVKQSKHRDLRLADGWVVQGHVSGSKVNPDNSKWRIGNLELRLVHEEGE